MVTDQLNLKGPVIVTGCQRSGTTIMTRIICNDLGYSFHQDDEFPPTFEGINRMKLLIKYGSSNIAIQNPLALYAYSDFYYTIPDLHFVGIVRDSEEIIDSMKRVKWMSEYSDQFIDFDEYLKAHVKQMKASWESLKSNLPNSAWTEIEYNQLKSHPLYIPKGMRKKFTIRQTKLHGSKVR